MRKMRLPAQLERRHLQDHREPLDDEEAAHREEEQLLLDEYRHRAESAAEGEAPDVAHEDLGRIAVPPEEAHRGPDHGAAEDRHLPDSRQIEKVQVLREDAMAGDVGEDRERGGGDERRPDGQAVEAVGQVHAVARRHHDEDREEDVEGREVRHEVLEEGEDEPRRVERRAPRGTARRARSPRTSAHEDLSPAASAAPRARGCASSRPSGSRRRSRWRRTRASRASGSRRCGS